MKHATLSTRESADDYHKVIARLSDRWRVIECRDGVQWILQYRFRSEKADKAPWVGRSYCRSRNTLLRCIREHTSGVDLAAAEVALAFLPAGCS
jgi:hypothetical protein